jgi:hypothetical protein
MNHLVLNEGLILKNFRIKNITVKCFQKCPVVSSSDFLYLPRISCYAHASYFIFPGSVYLSIISLQSLNLTWISLYLPRSTVSPINFSDLLVSPTNLSQISLYLPRISLCLPRISSYLMDQPYPPRISLYLPRISLYLLRISLGSLCISHESHYIFLFSRNLRFPRIFRYFLQISVKSPVALMD